MVLLPVLFLPRTMDQEENMDHSDDAEKSDVADDDSRLVFKSRRSLGLLFSQLPPEVQGRLLFRAMHHPDASTRRLLEARRLGH